MPYPPVYPPTPPPGLGYGGATYGLQFYGNGAFPRQPVAVTGGYGGQQYGLNSYGSLDITPPRVSGAMSLDGFRVEVYFSEEMQDNAALTDLANYTLTAIIGAPATIVSVVPGTAGGTGGYTSVIVTHTGSTLGGRYVTTVTGLEDMAGNPMSLPFPANAAFFYSLGDTPSYTVQATAGDTLLFQFQDSLSRPQDMLTEVEFSPGIEDTTSYSITTTYPIGLVIEGITQDPIDLSKATMTVASMTSAAYSVLVSPATAYDYLGDVLPSASTEFTGVEVGTGSSSASLATGLLLTKNAGVFYGWDFEDTSGRIQPASSFRLDFWFDASVAVYSPPLFDAMMGWATFSDGAVEVNVAFRRVGGADVIEVTSGAYFAQMPVAWSTGPINLSMLRNQKADSYAILINDVPLVAVPAASFTGVPTINPGTRFVLGTTYQVTQFKVSRVWLTSTQTVFTSTWNFLHGIAGAFTGSSALANDRILTKRGPLVKGWGDATPATVEDVEVRLDGSPVTLRAVNPYTGTIFPVIPIPRTAAGTHTVEVDYKWFPAPVMVMAGLNTPGLVLNKWDLPRGHTHPGTNPQPASSTGAVDTQRFPMGVVLGPMDRPQPIQIGHRYIGFEQGYSALLNSPSTLLLNQDPHRVSKPELEGSCPTANVTFNGETTPQRAATPWLLDGTDTGSLIGDGTYRVVDDSAGTYATGTAAVYYREEDFACPGTVRIAGRLQADEYVADGVFTGIGFGFHDNFRLYLMGLLSVNGLRHIGLLKDATMPQVVESWEVGPAATVTIVNSTTMTLPLTSVPSFVGEGSLFQILDGPQAGIYEIRVCGIDATDGTAIIRVTPVDPFPADPGLEGNDTATVIFDVPWDESLTTFSMVANTTIDDRSLTVFVGGSLVDEAAVLLGDDVAAIPADTSLLIPTGDLGRVIWGSISRPATNSTFWSLCRYSYAPHDAVSTVRGIVVAAEMLVPPEADANHPWFFTNKFGYSEIDLSGDLLLKSTSGSDIIDLSFGYARLEPALNSRVWADVDATFQVDSGVLGAGDASIRVRDDIREVLLTNLLYVEGGAGPGETYRRLITMSQKSLSGLMTPVQEGWVPETGNTLADPTVRGQQFTLTVPANSSGGWYTALAANANDSLGRIAEARLAITSYTADAVTGDIGPAWYFRVGPTGTARTVVVTLRANPARVALLDAAGTEQASFLFDWTDGTFHSYRLLGSPTVGSVVLVVDDVVQGSAALALFSTVAATNRLVGITAVTSTGSSVSVWDSLAVSMLPPVAAKRTLGVWKGGPDGKNSINSYQIPRTDTLPVLNSDASAVPYEMDWRSPLQVRVHLDQSWGVSIYRPDLPAPPWYTGTFATEITDPTAAWINVEYRRLPLQYDAVASIAFGSLDARSVTQQRWQDLRYRLYNTPSEEYIQPQGMVLNRYNVISSGEYNTDTTPEVVTVTSLTSTLLSIRSVHMNADRVFVVVVDNVVLSSSAWTFDAETQTITLVNPLPANEYPVTVTFAPGKPVTNTYLCSQPFDQSITKLNEGTPPYPKSRIGTSTSQVVFGTVVSDPSQPGNPTPDTIDNTPYQTIEWNDPSNVLYEELEFCQVTDGGVTGLLSIACDGPAPESGLIGLELSGHAYRDDFSVPGGPGGVWGGPSPVIGGTASQFDQTFTLMCSGGTYTDGVLGGGEPLSARRLPVMQPNWPGPDPASSGAYGTGMGVNQEVMWRLVVVEPYEDDLDLANTISDNTPPSFADPTVEPNPDGTPGVQLHGACAAEMVDYSGDAGKDRLGPWGGLSSLAYSLLGGGAPLDDTELTLNGGAPVPGPTVTTFQIEAAN